MNEQFYRLTEVETGAISDPIAGACLTAVYNSMLVVRKGQLHRSLQPHTEAHTKADGSLLTPDDLKSEKIANEVFQTMLPNIPFRSEEGTLRSIENATHRVGYDPLDGTRPYAVGATTSTVLCTVYNKDGSVYGAAIGEPSTGRIISAFGATAHTEARLLPLLTKDFTESVPTELHIPRITTWNGTIAEKGQVFIDNNQPYRSNGHDTISLEQHLELRAKIAKLGAGILELGSNGAHQFCVAIGGERAVAAITTARGIAEDTSAGGFLVERSGGAVQRYAAIDGKVSPVTSSVLNYDFLVTANSDETLNAINTILINLGHVAAFTPQE